MDLTSQHHQRFERVFGDLYQPLCSYAFTIVRDTDICEDIVQEVFARIWETRKDLLLTDSIRFYLFSAVRNNCLTHLRRLKSTGTVPWNDQALRENLFTVPKEESDKGQYEQWLREAIENLPEKCREVFLLSRIGKLKYKEIAGVLGISAKTVENQLGNLIAYCDDRIPLPPKPVLLTFDDGFRNCATIAYSLAKKYRIKINLFVVPLFIQLGHYRSIPCLQPADLEAMDPNLVEIGLHSYGHGSYADLTLPAIEFDVDSCLNSLREMGIDYQPCLAYPFGAFPRRQRAAQRRLFALLQRKGIRLAFRIGNRLNPLPLREKFLVQRIDIRGDESFLRFRLGLAVGRKLFGFQY
jgi:RNA polymerase sigma-70 factor (family 1)